MDLTGLLMKYNVPVPRYTSYPTVPCWHDTISREQWTNNLSARYAATAYKGLSLYIHLPYCESLCTYCGCNKKITTNHDVEDRYITALLAEWELYKAALPGKPLIRELHLGGGTPTFFSPANLQQMLSGIFNGCDIHTDHEFSFEGHPNNTTAEHLQTLYDMGFRRVSFGVQDNDPEVQRVINRIQPFENVKRVTELARQIGYQSVNFDLIYGLPLQTPESIKRTIEQTLTLHPDRVAFYSYAHVPWTARGQRLFDESHLPDADTKMQLYKLGKELFTNAGYADIGMDHFSLPTDSLYKASQKGRLFRNFMGYTTTDSEILIGLGVSSISDTGNAFAQNSKTIHDYYASVEAGTLDVKKGYFLTDEDIAFRHSILDITCRGFTQLNSEYAGVIVDYVLPELRKLEQDELVKIDGYDIIVTPLGRHFIRNIASAFDLYIQRSAATQLKFSKAI